MRSASASARSSLLAAALLAAAGAAGFDCAKARAEGEDRIALTVTFTGPYAKWSASCRELTVDFGAQLEPAMAFNAGCGFFAATPEIVALKQRSFTYTPPVR